MYSHWLRRSHSSAVGAGDGASAALSAARRTHSTGGMPSRFAASHTAICSAGSFESELLGPPPGVVDPRTRHLKVPWPRGLA